MPDEINFVDLVALARIKPDTTVERYGGLINSSLFDAANVLGTLSQKKLITFTSAMPGQNPISVTDAGRQLLTEADDRAKGDFDHLDLTILQQMQAGKRNPTDIGAAVNVRPRDLAMHLYRLSQQGYSTYEFRSGMVEIMLTEKGFAQAKTGMLPKPQTMQQQMQPAPAQPMQPMAKPQQQAMGQPMAGPQPVQQPMAAQQPMQEGMGAAAQPQELTPEQIEAKIKAAKSRRIMLFIGVVIVIILVAAGVLYYVNYLGIIHL